MKEDRYSIVNNQREISQNKDQEKNNLSINNKNSIYLEKKFLYLTIKIQLKYPIK